MSTTKKIRCTGCRREKDQRHFIAKAGRHVGKYLAFGFCRSCSQSSTGNARHYDAKKIRMLRRNCPEYAEHIRTAVRNEMRTKRLEKDASYHQGIVKANRAAQAMAIKKLRAIQGNYCAMESRGECHFHGKSPNIDHIHEDGRRERYRCTYKTSREILRMGHPEEKFQLLCQRHNTQKYHKMSPYAAGDTLRRIECRKAAQKPADQQQERVNV